MKKHPIVNFLVGLVASAFILGVVYLTILLFTFNDQVFVTIKEVNEYRLLLLILTIILTTLTYIIAKQLVKRSQRYVAFGICPIPFILLISSVVLYFSTFHFHTPFDKVVWQRMDHKPTNMASTLVKEAQLISMQKAELKVMLGEGFEEYSDSASSSGTITYRMEDHNWRLIISWKKDIVIRSELGIQLE